MIVYLVKNIINGKKYVGLTTQSLETRWQQHVYEAFRKNNNRYFYNSIRKYGKDSFKCSILEECKDEQELDAKEIYWINQLGSFRDGYNLTIGGEGGYKEITRKKMSLACQGKKFSDEHRKNLSISHMGISVGEKNGMFGRKGVNHHAFGKKRSKEAREKISRNHGRNRKIEQYDLDGKYLKSYDSIQQAILDVGGHNANIIKCCKDQRNKAYGYRWKYV